MSEVAAKRTVQSPIDVQIAIEECWEELRGEPIRGDVLALILALSDLETATWDSMFNFNLGNIVPVGKQEFFRLTDRHGNRLRFRSYNSLADGADGLINQLTSPTRPQWHDGLLSGDPTIFVESLKGLHGGPAYFEAPLDRYMKGFLNRYEKYSHLSTSQAPKEQAEQDSAEQPSSQLSSQRVIGSFEINVDCMGIPKLAIDIQRTKVTKVAQALLNLSGGNLRIDGQFGPITQKATLDYQLEHNLVATGTIDALTWASLIQTMKELNNGN